MAEPETNEERLGALMRSAQSGDSDAYAVMEKPMYEDLKNQGVPMREVGRDAIRVLVARR